MEELEKALEGVKYIPISVKDFIEYKKLQQENYKPANLGEKDSPLENNPFFLNDYEHRLLCMRYHLLQALGFTEGRRGWWHDFKACILNDEIKTLSDSEFLDAIEAAGVKVDFKLK